MGFLGSYSYMPIGQRQASTLDDMLNGGPMFDIAAAAGPGKAVPGLEAAPKKKRSFFSKDGAFWDVLGVLGDGLSGDHHYANMVLQRRQAELDEEWRRRREAMGQPGSGSRHERW